MFPHGHGMTTRRSAKAQSRQTRSSAFSKEFRGVSISDLSSRCDAATTRTKRAATQSLASQSLASQSLASQSLASQSNDGRHRHPIGSIVACKESVGDKRRRPWDRPLDKRIKADNSGKSRTVSMPDELRLRLKNSDFFKQDVDVLLFEERNTSSKDEFVFHFDMSNSLLKEVKRHDLDIHFGCMFRDDDVQNRLHWPNLAQCQVNDTYVPVMYRYPQKPMGRNGRDKPINITNDVRLGSNTIIFECGEDSRAFLFCVTITSRIPVKTLVSFIKANDPVDLCKLAYDTMVEDDIVVQHSLDVCLKCPLSLMRCIIPARSTNCKCIAVFDLESFLNFAAMSVKWICPHCAVPTSPKDIAVDKYIQRILRKTNYDDIEIDTKTGKYKKSLKEER